MSMYGECEMCSEKKKIRSIREKMCCATCEPLWRAANVQPDAMIRAIIEAKGEEWLAGMVHPQQHEGEPQRSSGDILIERIITTHNLESGTDVAAFVDNLVAEVDRNKKMLEGCPAALDKSQLRLDAVEKSLTKAMEDTTTAMRRLHAAEEVIETVRVQVDAAHDDSIIEAVQRIKRNLMALESNEPWNKTAEILGLDKRNGWEELPEKVQQLVDELHRLRQQVMPVESISAGHVIPAELSEIGGRDAALLDLALDVLAGRVSGLDAERIAALR